MRSDVTEAAVVSVEIPREVAKNVVEIIVEEIAESLRRLEPVGSRLRNFRSSSAEEFQDRRKG